MHQIKNQSNVIMPTKWLALQFISGWFFIEEINTTNTGVEIFVNLWAWDKYLAFCPFTLRVTVDILFHSSRHVPTIVAPQLSMYLTATTLLVYWESMSYLIFFCNSHIYPVTWNCTKAKYSPIEKLLKQCWKIKKLSK